jgi:hypothetical protein
VAVGVETCASVTLELERAASRTFGANEKPYTSDE